MQDAQAINNDGVVKSETTSMNGRFLIVMELLEAPARNTEARRPHQRIRSSPNRASPPHHTGIVPPRHKPTMGVIRLRIRHRGEQLLPDTSTTRQTRPSRHHPTKCHHGSRPWARTDRLRFRASGEAGAVGGSPAYQPPDAIPGSYA